MPALRTTLIAVGIGAATLTTGAVVATSAIAAPAPQAAVEQLVADPGATATPAAATDTDGTASGRPARTTARGWWKNLSDTQRTCLQGQDITRPVGPLDDAERATLRGSVEAAAKTCEVTLPFTKARTFWAGLTDEQQACLKDAGVNRPWGPLTKEQRQAVRADLRAAATGCGVTLPTPART